MAPAAATGGQQLHGHVPAAVAALRPVELLPAAQHLQLAIGLPARNENALTRLLADLYDPASPNFRHYLSPAQFAEQFGPSEADYQALVDFAKAKGLTVTGTHPNRLVLDVDGAIPVIEAAFHVTLHNYQHPREGRKFYAPNTEPTLDLTIPVLHINGLDNYSLPHPNHQIKPRDAAASARPNAGSAPGGAYAGGDFRAAYVPGTALTGAGQSVALLQFDGYYPSDIAAYKTQFGLPNVPLVDVPVSGGVSTPGTNNGEVCLDIEMVMAMAPGVSAIYVYMAANSTPWLSILSKMANDNLAKQISCSWGSSDGPDPSSETIFKQMATQGQSFFNATGDSDAFTGSVPFPSDSPSITQVGATTLTTTGVAGSYVSDTVWNWGGGIGSSGGSSTYYPVPSWQVGTSMATNQGSTTKRNLPDVALTGDNVYVRYDNGSSSAFGGTSCAAPLWAGLTALINQQAVAAGRAPVGFLNPAIYTLGNSTTYNAFFRDTTTGNNFSSTSPGKFSAVAGYDLCTGWGTPNGSTLIDALAGPPVSLQVSVPTFVASGSIGGPFTPTSVSCTLTNNGSAALDWTADQLQPWTSLSAAAGTLAPGANTIVTWSLNDGANTLATGTYADTVTFTDTASGIGQKQALSLTITPRPVLLTGTRVYNGMTAASGLVVSNNIDGANLTVTGTVNLVSKDVGLQAVAAAAPAPAVRVQTNTGNTGANPSNTISVTLLTPPVSGHTLVAVISTHGNTANSVTSITQTGAAWTRAAQATNSNGNSTTEIWYATNLAGAAKAITINQASSLSSAAVVTEYSGVLANSSLDQTASAVAYSSASVTGTTAATPLANELWIGGIGLASSSPTLGTPLNSFTAVGCAQSSSSTAISNAKVYALERLTNPGGTASSGGTLSPSVPWSGCIATFKTLPAITLTLGGSAAANYTLIGSSGAVTITAKALTLGGLAANNRTYDGTATATLTGSVALQPAETPGAGTSSDGLAYTGDTVSVSGTAAAVFADKHVAFDKPVTVTGYALVGAQAGNYSATQPAGLSAYIVPRPITVTAVSATKIYDGTTTAAGLPTLEPPLAAGDTTDILAQEFQDNSVAIDKTITPLLAINDGNGGANYGLSVVNDYTGTITPAAAIDFTFWRKAHFTAAEQSAGLADATADPDGDGLSNLAEYALGTDPHQFTPPPASSRDASGFSLIFTRPANLPDVIYFAESSAGLSNWSPVPLEVLVTGAVEIVRARYPIITGTPSHRFLRLRFELK